MAARFNNHFRGRICGQSRQTCASIRFEGPRKTLTYHIPPSRATLQIFIEARFGPPAVGFHVEIIKINRMS
jgi:hypothetical protein